jgi:anti-sigma B factor antagonist
VPVLQTTLRTAQIAEGRYAVMIAGEFDLESAPRVRSCLDELLDSGATAIVVDMLEVSFVDFAGIAVLSAAHKALARRQGELILVVDDPNMAELLTDSGLGFGDGIVTSLLEAVSSVVG